MKKEVKKTLLKSLIQAAIFIFIIYLSSFFFIINVTESLPRGIYYISNITDLKKGDIVIFKPVKEADIYITQDYKYMMKEVAALKEDKIQIIDNYLYINGENWGEVLKEDSLGNPLPQLKNIEIPEDEVFLATKAYKSFDSRYWGTLKKEKILKKAKLILKFY